MPIQQMLLGAGKVPMPDVQYWYNFCNSDFVQANTTTHNIDVPPNFDCGWDIHANSFEAKMIAMGSSSSNDKWQLTHLGFGMQCQGTQSNSYPMTLLLLDGQYTASTPIYRRTENFTAHYDATGQGSYFNYPLDNNDITGETEGPLLNCNQWYTIGWMFESVTSFNANHRYCSRSNSENAFTTSTLTQADGNTFTFTVEKPNFSAGAGYTNTGTCNDGGPNGECAKARRGLIPGFGFKLYY